MLSRIAFRAPLLSKYRKYSNKTDGDFTQIKNNPAKVSIKSEDRDISKTENESKDVEYKSRERKFIEKQFVASEAYVDKYNPHWHSTIVYENENLPPGGRKRIFQEFVRFMDENPIFTLQEAAVPREGLVHQETKYPMLEIQEPWDDFQYRSTDNGNTFLPRLPRINDMVVIGSGLVGSASAYYAKTRLSKSGEVIVVDKSPYSPHTCTSFSTGLISCQSKSRDVTRLANLSKELIRNLRNDILMTSEDYAMINFRPCTHLILWPESEANDVLQVLPERLDDGLDTAAKTPLEIEASYPFLKVADSDVVIGTHGNNDEALVDPVGLRNVYRTLAQAHGAAFVAAELVDFNPGYRYYKYQDSDISINRAIIRIPKTKELRSLSFAEMLVSAGHNTPFIENRAEMPSHMRDQVGFLHSIQPKLRIHYIIHSENTPLINFPVITDTDGSMLIREDYSGNFKYVLTLEESEKFLDYDIKFMDKDVEDPFLVLFHHDEEFGTYFHEVIKPRLVKRIPSMDDSEFVTAISGFESHNELDGIPVIGPHPYHNRLYVSAGYGCRLMNFAPPMGLAASELMIFGEEHTFDMTRFYFNRMSRKRRIGEFSLLNR